MRDGDYFHEAAPDESLSDFRRRRRAEEASSSLIVQAFGWIFRLAFMYGPVFYIVYATASGMLAEQTSLYVGSLSAVITYLIFSLVYFLKGMVIGLRYKSQRATWIIPWLPAVLIGCCLPASIWWLATGSLFAPQERYTLYCQLISISLAGVMAVFYYRRFGFFKDGAPRWYYWCYALGRMLL